MNLLVLGTATVVGFLFLQNRKNKEVLEGKKGITTVELLVTKPTPEKAEILEAISLSINEGQEGLEAIKEKAQILNFVSSSAARVKHLPDGSKELVLLVWGENISEEDLRSLELRQRINASVVLSDYLTAKVQSIQRT